MKIEPMKCYLLKDSLYIETMYNVLPKDMEMLFDTYEYLYFINEVTVSNNINLGIDVIGEYSSFYKSKFTEFEHSEQLLKMTFDNNSIERIMINHTVYLYNMYLYITNEFNNMYNLYKENKVFVDNFDKILGNIDLGVLEKELLELKNTKLNYIKNTSVNISKYKKVLFTYRNAYKSNGDLISKLNMSNGDKLYILLKCKCCNKVIDFDSEIVNKFKTMPKYLFSTSKNKYDTSHTFEYFSFYNTIIKEMTNKQIDSLNNAIEYDYDKIFKRYKKC